MKSWRTLPDGRVKVSGEGIPRGWTAQVRTVRQRWIDLLARNAARAGVPLAWMIAIVAIESGGDPRAVSPMGAVGLGQLMPINWRGLSRDQVMDPEVNVAISADMVRRIAVANAWELPRVASVYNAGGQNGADAPPKTNAGKPWGMAEDPDYINRIVAAQNEAIAQLQGTDAPAPTAESGSGIPLPILIAIGKFLWDEVK